MNHPHCVYIASPWQAATPEARRMHAAYAQACVADSLARGEAPLAPHLHYAAILDDSDPVQRAQGMAAGAAWMPVADVLALYTDLGESEGMRGEWAAAQVIGLRIERRTMEGWAR